MIYDVIRDSQILLHRSPATWEETIRMAALPLLEEAYVTEHYIDAMVEAVKKYGAYIVVGKGVALAHARPEDGVKRLGVSVMTMKEPIAFGHEENDPVQLVFCLAAVDKDAHLDIMRSIVGIINEPWKVEELAAQDSLVAFKEIMRKFEGAS